MTQRTAWALFSKKIKKLLLSLIDPPLIKSAKTKLSIKIMCKNFVKIFSLKILVKQIFIKIALKNLEQKSHNTFSKTPC